MIILEIKKRYERETLYKIVRELKIMIEMQKKIIVIVM